MDARDGLRRPVYAVGNERKQRCVYEVSHHLIEPLRAWCVRHLEDFDAAAFDRLVMSVGDDEAEDVLVWSRRNA